MHFSNKLHRTYSSTMFEKILRWTLPEQVPAAGARGCSSLLKGVPSCSALSVQHGRSVCSHRSGIHQVSQRSLSAYCAPALGDVGELSRPKGSASPHGAQRPERSMK